MTQLFNLESYIKLCQYAYQFDKNPDELIHSMGNLPRRYKQELITEYGMIPYRVEPVLSNHRSQQLEINKTHENNFLGEKLTQTGIQRLFIIRDTIDLLTLSTSQFLNYQETYLYQSAYYYWNYYQQFKHLNPDKPLIFIDLDCFECDRLIPIQRDQQGIPILNTKEPLLIQTPFNTVETYNQICRDIAIKILTNFSSNSNLEESAIAHLQKYLQKIAIFEQIPSESNTESISILVEIMYFDQIYYKQVQLKLADIENIVNSRVNFSSLEKIADPNYHWILISQYNRFPIIKQRLPQFLCVSSDPQSFPRVWEEKKQNSNFPLFGIYLDTIEFEIGTKDEHGNLITQWIQLSDQTISYEGSPRTLRGTIPETNQNEFLIRKNLVKLPIKVNGEKFLKKGIPQNYEILIENFPETTPDREDVEIKIKIEFILKLNAPPELKVSDVNETYRITSKLVDRVEESFGYIPYQQIVNNRGDQSDKHIQYLKNPGHQKKYKEYLEEVKAELGKISIPIESKSSQEKILDHLLNSINKKLPKPNNIDIFQNIQTDSSEPEVIELKQIFENSDFIKLPDLMIKSYPNSINLVKKMLRFVGKIYRFSEPFNLEPAFDYFKDKLTTKRKKQVIRQGSSAYFESLARTAFSTSQQKLYFDLFEEEYKLTKNQYLWGYARILLWYYNFQSKAENFNYKNHFLLITKYLLSKPANQFTEQYKQNAFLALSYLLTFREIDPDFFKEYSQEKQQAIQVIKHFEDEKVMLNQVSQEKSLNQLFAELIEGKASQSDIDGMIQAS